MSIENAIANCGVCNYTSFDVLWDLPKLPLTEKYGIFDASKQLYWDQKLLICNHCGHVQLGMQLSPNFLYTPLEYSFRTSQSKTAVFGSQLFLEFFKKLGKSREFKSLLDLGGNDLHLAKMVPIKNRYVVDPVCSPQDGQVVDGIKIVGKFIEQVDFQKEGMFPDLVFCRHVLEHVSKPRELIQQLFNQCHPEALYVFEIPCFENLMEANRFDAVFHQHYHYFDLLSFQRLITEMGGQYLAHLYNRQGSCGGALLIAFQRQKTCSKPDFIDVLKRKELIRKSIQNYRQQMQLMSEQLRKFDQNIYGYGASLMLATLGYHLRTDFSELICILDDDAQKDQISYQNVPIKVRYTGHCQPEVNSNYIITSLENTRSIFKRLMEFSPRRVLIPFIN